MSLTCSAWCPICQCAHDAPFAGFRTGWHYTAFRNWRAIKREGIRPYRLKAELAAQAGEPVKGVFVWLHPPSPREHAGNVLFHAVEKATDKIMRLTIDYTYDDLYRLRDGLTLWPYHDFRPQDGYWHDRLPATVLTAVRPEHIVGVAVYDLARLLRRPTVTRVYDGKRT